MKVRDRVKGLRRIKANELLPNPKNWRTHPQAQQDALRGLLAEVGFAGALLGRETPNGVMLIDGHLRAEVSPEMKVPVLVLDVTEEEADKLLASYDPLGAMAAADAGKLEALLRDVTTKSDAVQAMFDGLARETGAVPPDFQPVTLEEQGRLDEKVKCTCPECGHEFTP